MGANDTEARGAPLVTVFADKRGKRINTSRPMDLKEIERVIRSAPPAPDKDHLALLKLARFGDIRTEKDALRHDSNVTAVSGIVADYDGERATMAWGAERLAAIGLGAVLYTSPTHRPDAPRWRVIVRLARMLEGTVAELRRQHAHWVGVLNALLGGLLSGESATLSQSYYFGPIEGAPPPEIIRLEGVCLDEIENLPAPVVPTLKADGWGNGADESAGTRDPTTDAELRERFYHGSGRYEAQQKLSARWAARGMKEDDIEATTRWLLDDAAAKGIDPHNADGVDLRTRCRPLAESAVRKFGESRAKANSESGKAGITTGESDEEPWPTDPANLLGEFIPAPLSTADVPEEIGTFADLYAARTGIDRTPLLAMMVGACAAAITDDIQICADSSTRWFQQPRLWTLVIAPPGEGKTPTFKEALKPLRDLHHELLKQWGQDYAQWQKDCAKSDDDEKDEKPPEPPCPRVVIDDATLEALSEVLMANPRGVVVVTDEFSTWLGSLDCYRKDGKDRDRGQWLRLYDGGPNHIERVNRGRVYVPNWGASIITCTTPAQLQKLAKDLPEDGLIQRFLTFRARDRVEGDNNITERAVEAARDKYIDTVRRLYALQPRAHKGVVPLSPEAGERLRAWNRDNTKFMRAARDTSTALAAHIAKYPDACLRLALTFHCVRVAHFADKRARDTAAFPVPVETFEMAVRYLRRERQHAIALHLSLFGSPTYALAQDIARFVLAAGGAGLQRRDLVQRVHTFRTAEDRQQDAALRLLIDAYWLREDHSGYTKAGPVRFKLNPHLAACFARLAERVRENRAVMRDAINEAAADRRAGRE